MNTLNDAPNREEEMTQIKTVAAVETATTADFVRELADPEIAAYEAWFRDPKRGNGPLSKFERELLRSYLWWKLKVDVEQEKKS